MSAFDRVDERARDRGPPTPGSTSEMSGASSEVIRSRNDTGYEVLAGRGCRRRGTAGPGYVARPSMSSWPRARRPQIAARLASMARRPSDTLGPRVSSAENPTPTIGSLALTPDHIRRHHLTRWPELRKRHSLALRAFEDARRSPRPARRSQPSLPRRRAGPRSDQQQRLLLEFDDRDSRTAPTPRSRRRCAGSSSCG